VNLSDATVDVGSVPSDVNRNREFVIPSISEINTATFA